MLIRVFKILIQNGLILIIPMLILMRRLMEGADTHLQCTEVKSTVSEVATCTTQSDRWESASHKWWFSMFKLRPWASSKRKESVSNPAKITAAAYLAAPWLFLEASIRMDRLPMICLILTLSIMTGQGLTLSSRLSPLCNFHLALYRLGKRRVIKKVIVL